LVIETLDPELDPDPLLEKMLDPEPYPNPHYINADPQLANYHEDYTVPWPFPKKKRRKGSKLLLQPFYLSFNNHSHLHFTGLVTDQIPG
jgi:hypothetical protein